MDPGYLSRVEGGRVQPSESVLRSLAPVLSLREEELLLAAGRVPESFRPVFARQPALAAAGMGAVAALCAQPAAGEWPPFSVRGPRAIEHDFPFEAVSRIAEAESWRKEIARPPYHVHKWWAQRLGSVFRAAIIAAAAPRGASVMDLFHGSVRFPGLVVFDPFMGSGTTVGEAAKLGCAAIGHDINSVACRAARVGLGELPRDELESHFETLSRTAGKKLRALYRTTDGRGQPADALYFFWVKRLPCPECGDPVELFSRFLFARHASPETRREARAVCPECGDLVRCRHDSRRAGCVCGALFDPQTGPAGRTTARCPRNHRFPIAAAAGCQATSETSPPATFKTGPPRTALRGYHRCPEGAAVSRDTGGSSVRGSGGGAAGRGRLRRPAVPRRGQAAPGTRARGDRAGGKTWPGMPGAHPRADSRARRIDPSHGIF